MYFDACHPIVTPDDVSVYILLLTFVHDPDVLATDELVVVDGVLVVLDGELETVFCASTCDRLGGASVVVVDLDVAIKIS